MPQTNLTITPQTPAVRAAQEKQIKRLNAEKTKSIFFSAIALIVVIHAIITIIIGHGVLAYLQAWRGILFFLKDYPYTIVLPILGLIGLQKGIVAWRDQEIDTEIQVYPPFPPVPDNRLDDTMYIASAYTRNGKQPGDPIEEDDEVMDDPHIIMTAEGLFGNVHIKGAIGSGKTSAVIEPMMYQAIRKYPLPPDPENFPLGAGGRIVEGAANVPTTRMSRFTARLGLVSRNAPEPAIVETGWNPYTGLTPEEAKACYDELLRMHEKLRWGMFVLDAKGDLTSFVQKAAAACGRSKDVTVLRPDGVYTYNPLLVSADPLVQSEMVMNGIEAVAGQAMHQHYRSTGSEWLTNALTLLRVVAPTRVNFKSILRMARSEQVRVAMVGEADDIMRQAQEEEERYKRHGQKYTGIRVDSAMIEFFRDWDSEDSDPSTKQNVTSGLKSQAKFFVTDRLASFLCPEMPQTFTGFQSMFDEGRIIVLRMPLGEFSDVGRVIGILTLADAQQVALDRVNRPDMDQTRIVAFFADEIASYLNKQTKDFISRNRQSRVPFICAHQSHGQLIQSDRSFEITFNDNLRTKISLTAPTADAAEREVGVFGRRWLWRSVESENVSFNRVERTADNPEAIKPVGAESQGMTTRREEVQRPWFDTEVFTSLGLGEMVAVVFDGQHTQKPRMAVAEQFYKTADGALLNEVQYPDLVGIPHPIVVIEPGTRDYEYISSALSLTGYVIVEPLADMEGDLAGFKFITAVGTVVVSCDTLDFVRDGISDRMTDERLTVVFTDIINGSLYFVGHQGLTFPRPQDLVSLYQELFPDAKEKSFATLFNAEVGQDLPYGGPGSWEFHLDMKTNRDVLLQVSRDMMALYQKMGELTFKKTDEDLESRYLAVSERMKEIVRTVDAGGDPVVSATEESVQVGSGVESFAEAEDFGAPSSDPAGGSLEISGAGELTPDYMEDNPFGDMNDDAFSGLAYPDDLEEPAVASEPVEQSATPLAPVVPLRRVPETEEELETMDRAPAPMRLAPKTTTVSGSRPDILRPSPLEAPLTAEERADELGHPASFQFTPEAVFSIPTDSASTQPASATPADPVASKPAVASRRRNPRSARSPRGSRKNDPTLDLGLDSDSRQDRTDADGRSGGSANDKDLAQGAPID